MRSYPQISDSIIKLQSNDIGSFVNRENAELLLYPSVTTCFLGDNINVDPKIALPKLLNEMSHRNSSATALENFETGWQKK